MLIPSKSARLSAEVLEAREVPAVLSAVMSGKTLLITADDAATDVTASLVGSEVRVDDNTTGNTWAFLSSGVSVVEFRGGAGDDRFSAGGLAKPVRALGGAGDDSLTGGTRNDSLTGGAGDDLLAGGSGNDRYLFAPAPTAETDTVVEQDAAGADTLDFAAVPTGVVVDLGAAGTTVATHAGRVVRVPAAGRAAALENVAGGAGDDTLSGNASNNRLSGGRGNDRYRFDVDVAGGSDTVADTGGVDTIDFSASNAGVTLDLGIKTPQAVADTLTLTITSAAVIDNVTGGAGADRLTGNALANVLAGGPGSDTLLGEAGDDTYAFAAAAAAESDVVVELPGEGTDTLDFSAVTAAVTVDLASDTAAARHADRTVRTGGAGQAANLENATGGAGDDSLTGNGLANRLVGGPGADILSGLGGADALVGGAGNDHLAGGTGDDHLNGGAGADTLTGGDGNDILISIDGSGTDDAAGGAGVDVIWVDAGDEVTGLSTGEKVQVVGSFANGADRSFDGDRIDDPASPRAYKSYAGRPLFAADGPSAYDVKQGGLWDCWLLAGLGAIAEDSPEAIRQGVVDFDDGTYGVALGGKFYRVDDDLPGSGYGAALGRESSLWVAITEKAFAFHRSLLNFLPASYEWLEGGSGREVNKAFGNPLPGFRSFWAGEDAAALADLIADKTEGRESVTVGFNTVGTGVPIVSDHSYSVMEVERDSRGRVVSITLRNPWGKDGRTTNDANAADGLVTLTPAQIAACTGVVSWGKV